MSSKSREGAQAPLRDQHADATRRAILTAARQAFAAHGYAATPLEAIVGPAGLTKGALYHHFKDKAAVLEAVYIEMEQELAVQVTAAVMACSGSAWDRMLAAIDAFFTATSAPAYTRIVMRDAPLVLDAHHEREIDLAIGAGLVAELTADVLRETGRSLPVQITARMLLAAVSEAAMTIVYADDPAQARRDGTAVMIAMLEGLRAAPAPDRSGPARRGASKRTSARATGRGRRGRA